VNSAVRVKNALSLYLLGHNWDTIAESCGYSHRGHAFEAVQRELQRTLKPAAEEVRTAEILRLDGLLSVFYPKAAAGDGWSCDRVLRIMERRALYLGLDARQETMIAAQLLIRQYSAEVESV
jgi:hypothetical protein